MWHRFAIALATVLAAAVIAGGARAQTPDSSETPEARIAGYLGGSWTVKVGAGGRDRTLVVRGVAPPVQGFLVVARWGWIDAKGEPAALIAREEAGRTIIEGRLASRSQIRVEPGRSGRAEGTITYADGQRHPFLMTRVEPRAPTTDSAKPELAAPFTGEWEVKVGDEARLRKFQIHSLIDPGAAFMPQADYGWADQPASARGVRVVAREQNGGVTIEMITQAGSTIVARAVGPDRLEGTFVSEEGKESPIALTRGTTAVAAAGGKPMVIYVGAANCIFCIAWERDIGNSRSRSGFLASEEGRRIDYREVKTAAFRRTGGDDDWPADLRWVRDATYVGSGTPRFILVRGGRVILNVLGADGLDIKIRPAILKLPQ